MTTDRRQTDRRAGGVLEGAVLKLSVGSAYGKQRYYPQNPTAEILAALAGTKTFSLEQLEQAKKLGFTIEIIVKGL